MFYRSARTEAEEAGVATDGMVESTAKLRQELLALTGQKLDIQIDDHNFKSTYQVLQELSEIWDEIGEKSKINQSRILEMLGGKRNANVLASIIKNFKDAVAAAETAGNSMGSAWAENEKYLNSIEGKAKQVEAAFQTFANNIINSDIVKAFLEIQKAILNAGNALSSINMLLPTIAASLTVIKGIIDSIKARSAADQIISKLKSGISYDSDSVQDIISGLTKGQLKSLSIDLKAALKTDDAVAGLKEVSEQVSKTTVATTTLKGVVSSAGATVKTVIAGVKASLMSAGIAAAISLAISTLIKGVQWIAQAGQRAIDTAKEISEAYTQNVKTYNNNIDTLEKLRTEYDELNAKAGEHGEQGSLTANEYKRYKEVIQEIVNISPSVAQSYSTEGAALKEYTGVIDQAIAAQKELIEVEKLSLVNKSEDTYKGARAAMNSVWLEFNKAGHDLYDALSTKNPTFDFSNYQKQVEGFRQVLHDFEIDMAESILYDGSGNSFTQFFKVPENFKKLSENIINIYNALKTAVDEKGNLIFSGDDVDRIIAKMSVYNGLTTQYDANTAKVVDTLQAFAETSARVSFPNKDDMNISQLNAYKAGIAALANEEKSVAQQQQEVIDYTAEFSSAIAKITELKDKYGTIGEDGLIDFGDNKDEMIADLNSLRDDFEKWPAIVAMIDATIAGMTKTVEDNVEETKQASREYNNLANAMQNASSASSLLEKLKSGKATLEDTIPTLQKLAEEWNKLNPNGEQKVWTDFAAFTSDGNLDIEKTISLIEEYIDEMIDAAFAGTEFEENNADAIKRIKQNLKDFTTDGTEGVRTLTNAISDFNTALNLIKNIRSDDLLGSMESIISLVKSGNFTFSDFFDVNGLKSDTAVIDVITNKLIDELKALASAEGITWQDSWTETLKGQLNEAGTEAENATGKVRKLTEAISDFNTAVSLIKNVRSEDLLSSFQNIISLVESGKFSMSDFFDVDGLKSDAAIIDAMADKLIDEMKSLASAEGITWQDSWTDTLKVQLNEAGNEADKTTDKVRELTDAISDFNTAVSLIKNIRSDDLIGSFENIISLVKSGKFAMADFFDVDGLKSDTAIIELMVDNLIEEMKALASAEGITWQDSWTVTLKNQLNEAGVEADETTEKVRKLTDAISDFNTAVSLIKNIRSEDLLSSFENIISLVESGKFSMSDFFDENGLKSDTAVISAMADRLIDEMKALASAEGITWQDSWTETLKGQLNEAGTEAEKTSEKVRTVTDAVSELGEASKYIAEHVNGDIFTGSLAESLEQFYAIKEKFGDAAKDWNWSDFFDYDIDTGELRNKTGVLKSALDERAREVANAITNSMVAAGQVSEADGEAVYKRIVEALTTAKGKIESAYEDLTNAISKVKTAKSFNEAVLGYQSGDTDFLSMLESSISTAEELGLKLEDVFDFTTMQPSAIAVEEAISKAVDDLVKGKNYSKDFVKQLKDAAKASAENATNAERLKNAYSNWSGNLDTSGYTKDLQLTWEKYQQLIEANAEYANAIEYVNGKLVISKEKMDQINKSMGDQVIAEARESLKAIAKEYQDLIKLGDKLTPDQKKRITQLQAEARGYLVLANEIANASDAFNNFLNASDQTSGTMFTSVENAMKIIQDTLYNTKSDRYGKIGLDKFKASVKLVVGDDIEINSKGFKDAMDKLKRYVESNDRMGNFWDDLVANGFLDPSTGKLDATIEGVANKLGITTDLARALFEELDTVTEGDIEFDVNAEDAENEMKTLMELMNESVTTLKSFEENGLDINTDEAQKSVEDLNTKLEETETDENKISDNVISPKVNVSPLQQMSDILQKIANYISDLKNSKITVEATVTGKQQTVWEKLGSLLGLGGNSSAAGGFTGGGKTLVGELGREIVVDPKRSTWYTVGDKGPEFVNLPKGGFVLNSLQTAELLGDQQYLKKSGKSGRAYAGGLLDNLWNWLFGTGSGAGGKTSGNDSVKSDNLTRPTSNGNRGKKAPSVEDELKRIKEAFEKVNAEYEHYIKHQEQSYYLSERATDYDSMRIALLNQAEYYQTIYDEAMKAVEEMKQAGADDTNEELQSVEETAWGAYQSMMGIYDQVRDLLKGALNEEVDAIQSAFGNLKTAVEQYNETGHITIDTLQSLLDGGLQYLQFLTNEDGQLSINTDKLRELLQARKEQLAIETALSNISRIREAAEKGETETVNALIDATQDLGSSTWDLAKAQAAELLTSQLISQEQYEKLVQNIEAARQLAAMAEDDLSMGEADAIGQIKEKYEELNEQVDHYIKHLEQAQKVAQRYSNYNDNEGSIREQIAEYQRIIENCNQAIAEMEAEGADDTTKELQEMEETAWSARQSIWSLYDQLYSLRTDAIAARIDNIQSSISDFQKAMEEMSDTGMVTLDTFQSIVSNGMQYLQYLNIENGQLSVNQEAVEQMIRAKKEQLAVETAMSYLNQIEEALLAGEAQKVAELVSLTEDLSESTWAAVYAKLALLKTEGLSDEDAAQVESYIEKLRDLSDLVDTNIAAPVVETVEDRLASILDAFNEVKEDLEHYIAHQEQKFTEDERALDFGGMTAALQNEIGYYQQIYNKAQETIGELMANGADDTTKELQEVEEAAWSAYNSMNEAFDKINALRVDELNEELNRLKSTYNNLKGAIEEFNEHGKISLDSFEQLLSGGIQYLTFLQKEDGQYKMTEQSLKDYISARKEQLALETAMSYLANIRQALENGEVQRVNSLIDASNELSASTWDLVAAKAAELRVMGLTDDQYNLLLANLEKLKDLTRNVETDLGAWDAETTDPIEEMEEAFNNLNKEIEHYIAHQEQAYKLNERAWDFRGMEQALNNEVGYYKRIMEEAQSTIDQMKAAGADDTNESLQAVEESMWSAQNSMFDAIDKLRSLRVDALKEELDALTNSFDDLKTAADEYNKTGAMSLSTFESVLENGVQYLSLLDEEGGKYVIAKDRLQDYIQTRKEQLAIETAVSYLSEIREAMENGEEERLRKLIDATNGLSSSTWAMVDAQLAALKASGMSSEQYETVVSNVEKLRALANQVNTDLVDGGEDVTDEYEKQQDALNKILKFTEDLIRAEAKDQVDAIKKQIEEYKEIIRLKKESLQQTKEETEYQDEVADKVKEIAQLQSKADLLALDTSRTANAERQKLLQEIQNKQDELSKYQGDHAYDAQMEALDKEAEAYEESRQAEIEAIEKSVSSEEKVYQLAIARIRDQWDTLYADLINWNTEQGSVINQEITDAWNEALKAVQAYGGYVESLAGLEAAISGKNSNGNLVVADIPKYHGGGVTGEKGKLNDDEVLAILQKGELVVGKEQKRGLYTVVDFVKSLGERLGTKIGNLRNLNIAGTMMPAFAGMTAPGSAGMVETSNISFNNTFDVHIDGGVGDQAAARQFGNTIAETAANSLFDAFNRRGINIIQTLRQ